MFRPNQLTILCTSQCTTACPHCIVSSSKSRRDRVTSTDIELAIDGVRANGRLRLVIFAGGEPTLLGEVLLDGIAYAHSLGLLTRLVTNAAWATTDAKADAKLVELREAGLDELNLSADDYHLPDIPLANVGRAWRAARGKGFTSVCVGVTSGPNSKITAASIQAFLGEKLPVLTFANGIDKRSAKTAQDGTFYAVHSGPLQRVGRARRLSDRELPPTVSDEELDTHCPFAVRAPTLSPKNHFVACCGIEAEGNPVLDFGSVRGSDFADLFKRAESDVLVQTISRRGPKFLLEFVRSNSDLPLRNDFRSVCEVCEYVTTHKKAIAVARSKSDRLRGLLIEEAISRAQDLATKQKVTPATA